MPGTNLAFEELHPDIISPPYSAKAYQGCPGYFDVPFDFHRESQGQSDDGRYDRGLAPRARADAPEGLVYDLKENVEAIRQDVEGPVERGKTVLRNVRVNGAIIERLLSLNHQESQDDAPIDNIEHIVYDEDSERGTCAQEVGARHTRLKQMLTQSPASQTSVHESACTQSARQRQAEMDRRMSIWGHHTGLYDGTGYGRKSSSRPSTSTEENTEISVTTGTSRGSAPRTREVSKEDNNGNVAVERKFASFTSGDSDTLATVMRAYAAYEDGEVSSITEEDIAEDLDLANRMMNNSLGA